MTGAAASDVALLIARCVLAGVFLASGLAKAADRRGTAEGAHALGVPPPAVPTVALALPVLELAVAVGLLVPASAVAATVAAGLLLVVFTALLAVAGRGGKPVPCHCFGRRSRRPDPKGVPRNLALLAVAGFALAASGEAGPAASWSWADEASVLAVLVATAALAGAGALLRARRRSRRVRALEARVAALRSADLGRAMA